MICLADIYKTLDYFGGDLQTVTERPVSRISRDDWVEKGEWLTAAQKAGAERLFFVDNNPVIVFAECGSEQSEKIKAFNKIWSLARPSILFLASPGEITVYDLAQKPVEENDSKSWRKLRSFETVEHLEDIAKLDIFHRDNIESGKLFGDERFGSINDRADKTLIRDLRTVRLALMEDGLLGDNLKYAHSLIGRSIFIRYLEDRGVLTEDYFKQVARQGQGWSELLQSTPLRPGVDFTNTSTFYPKVLQNKDFTYTLFRKLAKDFNGDMFPNVEQEYKVIKKKHLDRIQGLLYGDTQEQRQLFFHAYRFDIVPLDLISSIYEEFYHHSSQEEDEKAAKKKTSSKARNNGAYYTPSALVEFVLSRVLTPKELNRRPRVLDPACGSGIFLVEAFRRMVRHEWHKKKETLTFNELKEILRTQIAGIEINEEAARITAFSLYLAMLHYLDPPAILEHIRQGNKLPNLLAQKNNSSENCYHSILCANTFDVDYIQSVSRWQERFGNACANVVIGNPPWGAPNRSADSETKKCQKKLLEWCSENERPIGDKEPSQAFLWRSLDFLRPNGKVGMLVSAGVLFKHGATTQAFRKQWLDVVKLREVFNFAHVRKFFFTGGTSPFVSIFFENGKQKEAPVQCWSAKQLAVINKTQTVLLSQHDLNILRDVDLTDNTTWKIFLFGRHKDHAFLSSQIRAEILSNLVNRKCTGQGYSVASRGKPANSLRNVPALIPSTFSRYDETLTTQPPTHMYRIGVQETYTGKRLLVQRGINEKGDDKGLVVARYCATPLCFTNQINGIKLAFPYEQSYLVMLGIMWSSFARYFFFMTSSNWGLWHHEVHLEEILQLPIVLDESNPATKHVIRIVDQLRSYHPTVQSLNYPNGVPESTIQRKRRTWERQLDEAVFDLYDLTEEQRDLIRDCCEITLPFFYKPMDSIGIEPVVDKKKSDLQWIEQYSKIFSRRWNIYLPDELEMRADLHIGAHENMMAVEFYPADKSDPWDLTPRDDWQYILDQLAGTLPQEMGTSKIVLDGLVYAVSDDSIIIIKRNLKRLWTRSLAREDADSTLAKRMIATMSKEGEDE